MKTRHLSIARLSFPLAAALAALLAAPAVYAGNTWDGGGGSGLWNTNANWNSDTAPSTGVALTFAGNVQNSTSNDLLAVDPSFAGILFTNSGAASNTSAFTLAGSRITLGGDITTSQSASLAATITDIISLNMVLSGNRTITTNQRDATRRHDLTISGNISEDVAGRTLTKAGAGILTLTGNNSYTGTTTISAGTVVLNNDGDVTSSAVTFGGSNTGLTVTGGSGVTSIWNNNGGTFGIPGGQNYNNVQVLIDGAGTAGSARLTNVNILSWGGAQASATNSTITLTNGGQMNVSGEVRLGGNYYSTAGGANMTIGGGTATSTFTGNAGSAFYIGYGEREGVNNNVVTVNSGGVLTSIGNMFLGQVNNTQGAGGVATANRLTVTGTGTASMVSVTVGYAQAGDAQGSSNANVVEVTNGGTLTTSGGPNYIGRNAIAGTTTNSNTLTVTGAGSTWNAGNQNVIIGSAAASTTANNNILTVGSGGTVTGVGALTVGSATGTSTGNQLVVNGSLSATTVTVSANNSLSGIGTVTGPVTVNGTVDPGNGVSGGTLTLGGPLTLATGAKIQVSNPGSSLVQVNGNYTDALGAHTLLFPSSITPNTPYPFLQWTGTTPAGMVTGAQGYWSVLQIGGSTVNWIAATSNNWTNGASWDGLGGVVNADTVAKTLSFTAQTGTAPVAASDVIINPATAGITITGPASPAVAINSLQIGGTNNLSPTLTLGAANFSVTGAVNVVSNGTLNATSGALIAPTLNVSGSGAAATLGHASGAITTANVSAGTLTVNAGTVSTAVLTGTGSLAGTQAIPQVNVTGGTPSFSGNATTMTVTGGGVATTGGTIGVFNSNTGAGTSTIGSGTAVTTANVSAGTTNIGSGAAVTTANVSAGTVNFNSTVGGGTLAVTGGTTNIGTGAKVATANFSAGTVNAANPLTITSTLIMPTTTATLTGGTSFTAQGTNLANSGTASTLTLSGGTLTLFSPAAPAVTGINYFKITGDSDSGLSTANTYTHAINPAGGSAIVNSIPFTGAGTNTLTSLTSKTYTQPGTGTITINNSIGSSNFGNTAISNNLSGWTGVSAGGMRNVFGNFNYWGTAPAPVRTVVLTGLTPDTWYDLRLYEKQWDTSTGRTFSVAYDVGNNASTEYTSPTIDQNNPQSTSALSTLGIGQQNAWAQSYVYKTGAGETSITMAITNGGLGSYHFYGLSNQVVSGVGSGVINFPNTAIAATASSVLDLGTAAGAHNLASLNLAANGTTTALSLKNGATLTLNGDASNNAISATGTAGQTASILPDATSPPSLIIASGKNVSVGTGVTLTVQSVISGGAVTKIGGGTLTLTGTHTYTGATTVSDGTLIVNGSISTSITTVQSGATLGGSGSVGALTIDVGGFHNPGNSPAIQNTGNYSLAGSLGIEITGNTPGVGGYDQVNTTGSVTLSGLLAVTMSYTPVANELFFILANDSTDAIVGTFSNAPTDGSTYTLGGQDFQISYFGNQTSPGIGTFTGGNDVVLMAIPEPNVAALLGGLGALMLLRRRR